MSAVNRCADCKHWETLFPKSAERGKCKRITVGDGLPRVEGLSGDYAEEDPSLVTPPDFGCALFERKETP